MMYRTVACDTWGDPWFAELPADGKLLFLYLFTNPRTTAAGAYEITARQMAFDTGLSPERVNALLAGDLADKVTWWPDLRIVWVRNFYRRQRAVSNDKFTVAARRVLADLPALVGMAVGAYYPELASNSTPIPPGPSETVDSGIRIPLVSQSDATPIPSPSQGGNETVTGSETESETVTEVIPPTPQPTGLTTRGAAKPAKLTQRQQQAFDALWGKYPARNGSRGPKQEAAAAFARIAEADWPDLARALDNYRAVCSGPDARLPKDACRFLKDGYWRDYVDIDPPPQAIISTGGTPNGRPTHADREAARLRANLALIAS